MVAHRYATTNYIGGRHNFAGSNDPQDKNVTVGHNQSTTRFTAMRASLLCYPATRFESGSEFVVFVLFY